MRTQTFLIRCEYPDGDRISTQEFVENIQEYFAANIMDGERGRLVVKPVYQPKEEGLVKEETKFGTASNPIEPKSNANSITQSEVDVIEKAKTYWDSIKDAWICPEGYQFVDENGNVINATKIVLEKKRNEYPKTYEECCKVMGVNHTNDLDICEHCDYKTEITYYEDNLLERIEALYRLIICRDAYWKIAGEEKKLGEPWKPDYDSGVNKYGIICMNGVVQESNPTTNWERHLNKVLDFPTEEMRAAFYVNFKDLIEFCKELL